MLLKMEIGARLMCFQAQIQTYKQTNKQTNNMIHVLCSFSMALRNCNQERSDNHQEGCIEKYMHTTKILASGGVCIVSMDCKYWHFNFVVCTGSSSDIGIYLFFAPTNKLLCIKIQLYIKKPTKAFVH